MEDRRELSFLSRAYGVAKCLEIRSAIISHAPDTFINQFSYAPRVLQRHTGSRLPDGRDYRVKKKKGGPLRMTADDVADQSQMAESSKAPLARYCSVLFT